MSGSLNTNRCAADSLASRHGGQHRCGLECCAPEWLARHWRRDSPKLGHDVMMGSRTADNTEAKSWRQRVGSRARIWTFRDGIRRIMVNCTQGAVSPDVFRSIEPKTSRLTEKQGGNPCGSGAASQTAANPNSICEEQTDHNCRKQDLEGRALSRCKTFGRNERGPCIDGNL